MNYIFDDEDAESMHEALLEKVEREMYRERVEKTDEDSLYGSHNPTVYSSYSEMKAYDNG